jgi:hypothetical protein
MNGIKIETKTEAMNGTSICSSFYMIYDNFKILYDVILDLNYNPNFSLDLSPNRFYIEVVTTIPWLHFLNTRENKKVVKGEFQL